MEAIFELGTPFSRTLVCEKCFSAGRPDTTTAYVVYAGARRQLIIKIHVGVLSKDHVGLTPHIIYPPKNRREGDTIYCKSEIVCGIIGCGFKAELDETRGVWRLEMIGRLGEIELTSENFNHLVIDPPREYYLSHVDDPHWDVREIIEGQQRVLLTKGRR